LERLIGSIKQLVSCWGRSQFAEEQTVDGYGCGGEDGDSKRFVSSLWPKIQPSKDEVGMIITVNDGSEKS
jgi:hypothetical protein